jgi:hypothetical protein
MRGVLIAMHAAPQAQIDGLEIERSEHTIDLPKQLHTRHICPLRAFEWREYRETPITS